MASGEAAPAPAPAPAQTLHLLVSIHCEGCKKKVRKVLKSVEGVQHVTVDGAQKKVTVTGTVDADTLVRRLYKSGKQAVQWHPPAAAPKKPEAAPVAPEALPAPLAGDGGKDDSAANKKTEEQPLKEPQAKSSEKKPQQEAGSEKKPEAEKETESEKKAEKEEAKPSDEATKDGDESEAQPVKEPAAAAKETGNDEEEAKKKKSGPKGAGEAEPASAAVDRFLSPEPAPKHAHEEYYAPQPVLRYHMGQPSASVSYYAPRPEPAYSGQQQPPQPAYSFQQPQQQWSPSYLYMPYPHTAPESYYHDYYGPPGMHSSPPLHDSPPLQDSYRIFDDENPNACSVM